MNDANFSACKFSADIVPYLYGELSDRNSYAFESHLVNCGTCTDEFAEVSAARYEVYEWKKLAFDPLPTPRFEIAAAEVIASESWFDRLRDAFRAGWVAPAFALGGLMIISLLAASFILSSSNGGPNIAANIAEVNASEEPVLTALPPTTLDPLPTVDKRPKENNTPRSLRVRVATPDRTDLRQPVRPIKAAHPQPIEVKSESAQNKKASPLRLNGFTDDEDTSLRLAELLDDIETSK